MSTTPTVRLVFGYPIPEDVLGYADHAAGYTVDPVACMCGGEGDILFATASARHVVDDSDGYSFRDGLIDLAALPDPTPYLPALEAGVAALPEARRPTAPPRWLLHIDVGWPRHHPRAPRSHPV